MEPLLSIIIPVYRENIEDLNALYLWIDKESTNQTQWILSICQDSQTLEQIQQSEFNQDQCIEDNSSDKLKPISEAKNIAYITSSKGRSIQMNKGAAFAQGEILVFLHADTFLVGDWIEELTNCSNLSWGSFTPKLNDRGLVFRLAELWGSWRTRMLGYPYGDQCIFVKQSLFQRAGGFDEEVQFMEDLELSKNLKSNWGKPAIMSSKALTSSRLWHKNSNQSFLAKLYMSWKNLVAFGSFLLGMPRKKIQAWYQK